MVTILYWNRFWKRAFHYWWLSICSSFDYIKVNNDELEAYLQFDEITDFYGFSSFPLKIVMEICLNEISVWWHYDGAYAYAVMWWPFLFRCPTKWKPIISHVLYRCCIRLVYLFIYMLLEDRCTVRDKFVVLALFATRRIGSNSQGVCLNVNPAQCVQQME
jgi:hypothetical protein